MTRVTDNIVMVLGRGCEDLHASHATGFSISIEGDQGASSKVSRPIWAYPSPIQSDAYEIKYEEMNVDSERALRN
jgi:hypothetical protein